MAAEITYPLQGNFSLVNDGQPINTFDQLYLVYESSWPAVNLTVFCAQTTTSDPIWYHNVPDNPLVASGTYDFGSMSNYNFGITQYPTPCYFKFTQYGNNEVQISGQVFEVSSNSASSTTFESASPTTLATSTTASSSTSTTSSSVPSMTTTTPTSTAMTTTQSSTSSSSSSFTSSSTSEAAPLSPTTSTTSPGITASAATSSIPSSTLSPVSHSTSGLSVGAKAGIGVGVALGVLLLGALAVIFCLLRRQRRGGATAAAAPVATDEKRPPEPSETDRGYSPTEWACAFSRQAELEGHPRHELYDRRGDPAYRPELPPASMPRYELSQ